MLEDILEYRKLGRTGLDVSEVGLGTWAFASQAYGDVAKTSAMDTIRAALDSGITLFGNTLRGTES